MSPCQLTRRAASIVVVVLIGGAQLGCGGGAGNSTTVRGTISYNGKPVTFGAINFFRAGTRPLGGAINSDGSYECQLPLGEYQVRVDTPPPLPPNYKEGDPIPQTPRPVPEKYASFATSELKATITAESPQQLDFVLP
jgi:hypothetical protein